MSKNEQDREEGREVFVYVCEREGEKEREREEERQKERESERESVIFNTNILRWPLTIGFNHNMLR